MGGQSIASLLLFLLLDILSFFLYLALLGYTFLARVLRRQS